MPAGAKDITMPSAGDTAVIAFLAFLLFGPKNLPELARHYGKLMAEARRAWNELRTQLDDELLKADQVEKREKSQANQISAPMTVTPRESTVLDYEHFSVVVAENRLAAYMSSLSEVRMRDHYTGILATPLPLVTTEKPSRIPATLITFGLPNGYGPEAGRQNGAQLVSEGCFNEA
jgi:sec-independent protein translocase protein TatB